MAKPPGPIAQQLKRDLDRYRSLRQHKEDPVFRDQLYRLQTWQSRRMRKTHHLLVEDERYRAATEFFLAEFYGGVDLSDLANEAERALNKALRVLPEKVMLTATYALDLNALSAELDEKVTEYLFNEMGESKISMTNYLEAFRNAASLEERLAQVELAKKVSAGMDKYVRSKIVYATFKVVKRAAYRVGIRNLYDFMGKAFEVMHPMGSASVVIDMIVDKEAELFKQIYANETNPYGFDEVEGVS